jgi:hypothetical protein
MGIPENGWFAVENPWKSYEHGWFRGTPTLGNHHTVGCCSFPEKLHWKCLAGEIPRLVFSWIQPQTAVPNMNFPEIIPHFLKQIWTRSISQFWHRNPLVSSIPGYHCFVLKNRMSNNIRSVINYRLYITISLYIIFSMHLDITQHLVWLFWYQGSSNFDSSLYQGLWIPTMGNPEERGRGRAVSLAPGTRPVLLIHPQRTCAEKRRGI